MVISKKKLDKDDVSNLTVTTEEQPTDIDPSNQDIAERAYVFPMLAVGIEQIGRKYPDDPRKQQEGEWSQFKAKTDMSIPIKRTITHIFRIRTLSNEEQALGEYVYYMANLTGFQKGYSGGKLIEYPNSFAADIPFGMDIQKMNTPKFKNGQSDGFTEGGEQRFYTVEFTPEVIDSILEKNTPQEGQPTHYSLLDAGSNYGGFTQEEVKSCKFNRLTYRNTRGLNGTDILPEDRLK